MARLFVLGEPCSGKTTAARRLRPMVDAAVLDMDDEVFKRNGDTWPDIETRNHVLVPQVLAKAAELDDVIVLNSYSLLEWTHRLRADGFTIVLLDLDIAEQLRRDGIRFAEEAWSNREWFDFNRTIVKEHRRAGLIDIELDASLPVDEVASTLAVLLRS